MTNSIAIMQPYFFPYLGYFQLMSAVDAFIVYDNIQFTKKGWIHRNRILVDGKECLFSINLVGDSDNKHIVERAISPEFEKTKTKLLRQLQSSYRRCLNFTEGMQLVEQCLNYSETNLFRFIFHSLKSLRDYLGIDCTFAVSSQIPHDQHLKHQDRVIAICKSLQARTYINPEGGVDLYDRQEFAEHGIVLKFLRHIETAYSQTSVDFVPRLSVIDVIMNNSRETARHMLGQYELF